MIIPTENPPAKLVNRLNKGNRQTSSLVRFMPGIGYFRVSVIGLRYFDRGAGGFMGGGAWIFEGRVVCSAYPEEIEDALRIPTLKSKAGWGYQGMVSGPSGQSASVEDKASTKHQIQSLNQEFWSLDEALAYANGDDGGLLANSSEPVSISRTKDGYRLKRKTQENSMPKETIRISCDGAPGPGLAWTIVVEFRPLSRGYSVWAYQNNIMTDKPKWKRVESSKQPLTWRAAYQSLVANC